MSLAASFSVTSTVRLFPNTPHMQPHVGLSRGVWAIIIVISDGMGPLMFKPDHCSTLPLKHVRFRAQREGGRNGLPLSKA